MSKYKEKHLKFLCRGYIKMRVPELTRAFNKRFGTDLSEEQIHGVLSRYKIRCGRKPGFVEGERYGLFTKRQVAFIEKKYRVLSLSRLTVALNEKYGSDFTVQQLRWFTRNHRIRSGRTGCYEKGHKPWNAGTKGQGLTGPNSGSFKKGNVPANTKLLGAERICPKDGYALIKVAERNPYTGCPTRYKAKHIVLWEKVHGLVPPGKMVCFADGNNKNISIDNLMLVDRALHVRLNQNHYAQAPDELKPSILTLSKLQTKKGARKRAA
jgi:hypothetical protein